VTAVTPLGAAIPGPVTTANLVRLDVGITPCKAKPMGIKRNGNVIDIVLYVSDPCIFGTLPALPREGFTGYLPAGSYTGRYLAEFADGSRVVGETLQFEVVEAGPPLQVPTMSEATLAILAILLAAFGTIVVKRGA